MEWAAWYYYRYLSNQGSVEHFGPSTLSHHALPVPHPGGCRLERHFGAVQRPCVRVLRQRQGRHRSSRHRRGQLGVTGPARRHLGSRVLHRTYAL